MLLKQLLKLTEATAEEVKNDAYVKITSGKHKGKTGYVNKLMKSNGVVTAVEIEFDDDEGEFAECTPDQLKVIRESVVTEGAQYDSSENFEDDISKLHTALESAMKILKSAEWKDWMRSSDSNYPSKQIHYSVASKEALAAIELADKKIDALYDALVEASE